MSTEVRLGQYCGTIKLGENILAKVKEKYNFKNESSVCSSVLINSIS